MLCVIPFCTTDLWQATDLVRWIGDLGCCKERHDCLLVVDAGVPWDRALKVSELAEKAFKSCEIISNPEPVKGWIAGSVSLWRTAAEYCAGRPFWFNEPDCIPLKVGWLDDLESAYNGCGKPFMGALVQHQIPNWPNPYLEGCAVYPANAWQIMQPVFKPDVSWTRACASVSVPLAADTGKVHHLWGEKDNAPIFAETNVPHTCVFCLKQIKPEAVVFHRNKDGSLVRLLRDKLNIKPQNHSNDLVIVFPFCNKDGALFVKNVQWMKRLRDFYAFDAVLSCDFDTKTGCAKAMFDAVSSCFRSVHQTRYALPPGCVWPAAASRAFRHAAYYVAQRFNRPFLWLEFDMIPLKPEWLDSFQTEYNQCGKGFMGPIIPKMGHMNGTGVYPANTPARIPKALGNMNTAWDVEMKAEMIADCHDCSNIFQHVWGCVDGKLHPYSGGPPNFNLHPDLINQLDPNAVVFHRCKNGSLIDQLVTQRKI